MNKLLFVTTVPDTIAAFFIPIARYLQAKGWRVDAMAEGISTSKKCIEAFEQVWEVKFSRNPLAPQNLLVAPQQIKRVLQQQEYDLIVVSTPVASFVTRYALNEMRKQGKFKMLYMAQGFHFFRGGSLLRNATFFPLEKLAGPWTDRIVVVNREDEEAAKRHLVPAERVHYIPGTGVDLDRFNPALISDAEIIRVRQELGLSPEAPLLLSVAEFIPRKRNWDVLKAFARLGRSDAHLALAGDGRLLEQMQQLASKLGIQKQVHFLGFRRDIPTLMRASVAIVLASEQEGLPNCIMESFCMETPAIGSNIRGTRDLLEGGQGLLFEVGDVEELARSMAWVLDRPEEAKVMGKRGRNLMADYELQHVLQLHETLYNEVVGEKNYAISAQ